MSGSGAYVSTPSGVVSSQSRSSGELMLTSSWKSSQTAATSGSTYAIGTTSDCAGTPARADKPAARGTTASEGEQPVEQVAVPAYGHPQFLGVVQLGALPAVQLATLAGRRLGEPLDHVGHQRLRLVGGPAGIVDEPQLDLLPPVPETVNDLPLPEGRHPLRPPPPRRPVPPPAARPPAPA